MMVITSMVQQLKNFDMSHVTPNIVSYTAVMNCYAKLRTGASILIEFGTKQRASN